MDKDEERLLRGRLRDLSQAAYQRDILRHTNFLSLSEQALYHRVSRELAPCRTALCGGHPEADRAVLAFLPSYMEAEGQEAHAFSDDAQSRQTVERGRTGQDGEASRWQAPTWASELLACVRIDAAHEKFAEPLTHRDYLGALMNLGIERAKTGDILADGQGTHAFLFCTKDIAPLICEELDRVRHTTVRCTPAELSDCDIVPAFEQMKVNVASERLDAVIAAVWKLSRSEAAALCAQEAVFADGESLSQPGCRLKEGARVSVRGYGKFIYEGMINLSRKGRLFVEIRKFI